MNKKLVKEMKYEIEELRKNSVPLDVHTREVEKLKRDKANIAAALDTANKALSLACKVLAEVVKQRRTQSLRRGRTKAEDRF